MHAAFLHHVFCLDCRRVEATGPSIYRRFSDPFTESKTAFPEFKTPIEYPVCIVRPQRMDFHLDSATVSAIFIHEPTFDM